jgi:hypothetical protein
MAFLQDDVGGPADGGTLAFGSNVAANSLLIATVAFASNTITVNGITDTRGNTWTLVRRKQHASSAAGEELWIAHNATAGACTLTFDWSGTTSPQVMIAEFSGFANGVVVDQSNGQDFSSDPVSAGNITPVETTNVCVVAYKVISSFSITAYEDSFITLTNGSRSFEGYRLDGSGTFDGSVNMSAVETGSAVIANIYNSAGTPTATRGRVSFAEFETPLVATRGRVSFAEFETPLVATRGRISWGELEAPIVGTRGRLSFAELEVPGGDPAPTRGQVSWAELEAPLVATRGRVSVAELEAPFTPTRGRVSFAELEAPFAPTRGRVSWTELETPLAPTRGRASFMELETGASPARGRIAFAELEVPDVGGPSDPGHAMGGWSGFSTPMVGGFQNTDTLTRELGV